MDAQLRKGLLEFCVLADLREQESYGYQIIKDVSDYIEISESTLYPILRRLESAEYVTSRTVPHNNRLRKYFQITEKGRRHLEEFAADQTQMIRVLQFIAGGMNDE